MGHLDSRPTPATEPRGFTHPEDCQLLLHHRGRTSRHLLVGWGNADVSDRDELQLYELLNTVLTMSFA